jgi:hypothetical protein
VGVRLLGRLKRADLTDTVFHPPRQPVSVESAINLAMVADRDVREASGTSRTVRMSIMLGRTGPIGPDITNS